MFMNMRYQDKFGSNMLIESKVDRNEKKTTYLGFSYSKKRRPFSLEKKGEIYAWNYSTSFT